ncbi:ATP-binding cassette domain-containing protein [Nakamurella sp. YIM 132087]|uniref:ATP-binding cassette domain-containing protein n=1 Tax=Nakamurella alba TaxID=2665158 RepID=A0A7K1FW13_9ACTN|nr:sugar ABC transporter ATP-binding protein [Nakamurella alba]MTD17403.1 ATP-binding cassette domain-containing protein [Nakamurella alba]
MTSPATPTAPGVPALQVVDVSVTFPGVRALRSVDMTVGAGSVHALLGENGAGKSTLIKVITGAQKPDTGSVLIGGQELRTHTPRAAQRLGVRVVHQERQIAKDLSVAQNVLLDDLPSTAGRVGYRTMVRLAQEHLDRVGVAVDARALAGDLTAAQQQLVELVRAVHRPAPLVVMDEPTASLRRSEVDVLFRVIDGLRAAGTSLLYISHHLHEVFEIVDRATVLRNGAHVADLAVAETDSDELVRIMFDRDVAHTRLPRPDRDHGRITLSANGVARAPGLRTTDVELRSGEILALCGAAGSGTSELAEVLAGAQRPDTGMVTVGRSRLGGRSGAASQGIGFVPADRKAGGLLLERSISENLLLSERGPSTWLFRPRRALATAREALRRGRVRADDPQRPVATLSGGNQQRVIFARWLLAGSDVLVLDQPTAGVDVAAKFEIYEQLIDLTAQGLSVVMVSSDYEEIACLADRVLVFRDGSVVAEVDGAEVSPERLYQLEMGTGVTA